MHNIIVYLFIIFVHLLPNMFRQVTVTQLTCSNTLLLDTLDLVPGMSNNKNLGITSPRDARQKQYHSSKTSTRIVQQHFMEDFNILKVLTLYIHINAHLM
jgi:hypothetical protein